MGRKSQEKMTGKTYEQRVSSATGFWRKLVNRIKRINKPAPTRFANVRRDGVADVNPRLIGKASQFTHEERRPE